MYDLKVDKKIQLRARLQTSALTALLMFSVVYAIYPVYAFWNGEGLTPAVLKKKTKAHKGKGFLSVVSRNTVSIYAGCLGLIVGLGLSKEVARGWQRRHDLKKLIEQGKSK
ncbi:hypothetical protein [Armatimonas sp.]|uniref:hypothetical protein n=1 Tax=Armatimonas sp. TaxID=1872638 RepID=UPI00286B6AAE|nr:hypothetical protein [Armatimonas sp.]